NGFYERELMLSVGRIKLRVPRTRNGEFNTSVFERYKRTEKSLILAMIEMVVNGVSTRKVTNVVEELCGETVSKSMVSTLTESLQEEIETWNQRNLSDMDYCPYVFFDAMYTKVRDGNRVVPSAVYIAKGITDKGKRVILGFKIDKEDSYDTWRNFISDLKGRGLTSPRLAISDAHKGLKKAIETEFLGTSWQRCVVHFKRNIVTVMPRKNSKDARHDLKMIYHEIHPGRARELKNALIDKYEHDHRYKKAIETLENGFEDSIQYMNEAEKRHQYIRSTNALERIIQKVRAREKIIKIFPHQNSTFRIVGSILMEYEEKQIRIRRLF